MGLPRYLAAASVEDLERTLRQADDLIDPANRAGGVALIQCARKSDAASELAALLQREGRHAVPIIVKHREQAKSDALLSQLETVKMAWVFADNLFETFLTVFATDLAFALRARAREGMPVIGIGDGALALGGLLVANRVCPHSEYHLVGGLGWAPRVLVDTKGSPIARNAARSLPGLLAVQLNEKGSLRVEGGRVESIGDDQIVLIGADELGRMHTMSLEPGEVATIAPPPFAPFDRALVAPRVASAVKIEVPKPAPQPAVVIAPTRPLTHAAPGSGKVCPMCKKVHGVELAA